MRVDRGSASQLVHRDILEDVDSRDRLSNYVGHAYVGDATENMSCADEGPIPSPPASTEVEDDLQVLTQHSEEYTASQDAESGSDTPLLGTGSFQTPASTSSYMSLDEEAFWSSGNQTTGKGLFASFDNLEAAADEEGPRTPPAVCVDIFEGQETDWSQGADIEAEPATPLSGAREFMELSTPSQAASVVMGDDTEHSAPSTGNAGAHDVTKSLGYEGIKESAVTNIVHPGVADVQGFDVAPYREAADTLPLAPALSFGHAYAPTAPTRKDILNHMDVHCRYGLPHVDPFYSNPEDHTLPIYRGGLRFDVKAGRSTAQCEPWQPFSAIDASLNMARNPVYVCGWEFWEGTSAPARVETVRWLNAQDVVGAQASDTSKAKGDKKKKKKKSKTPVRSRISLQHMTMSIMALELCAPAEEEPHPDHHPIAYLSYVFQPLDGLSEDGQLSLQHGYIAVAKNRERLQILGVPVQLVSSEVELIELICQITLRLDPDILLGWEVQRLSWGYLKYRAELFGISCANKFRPIYDQHSRNEPVRNDLSRESS
jgi:hypothetical protein